jgi:hypothetical protein
MSSSSALQFAAAGTGVLDVEHLLSFRPGLNSSVVMSVSHDTERVQPS